MTINVTLSNLANLTNDNTATSTINANSTTLVQAFSSALNTSGDRMLGTLDMNSNQIINLPAPATANSPARLVDVTAAISTSTSLSIVGGTNINVNTVNSIATVSTVTSPTFSTVSTSGTGYFHNITMTGQMNTAGISDITAITTPSLLVIGPITASTLVTTGSISTPSIAVSGSGTFLTIQASTLSATTANFTGNVSASGSVAAANLGAFFGITGNVITAFGAMTTPNLLVTTNISTSSIVVSSSGSATMSDGSIWSATGITNSTGVIYSITGNGGLNIYGISGGNAGITENNFGANGAFSYKVAAGTQSTPTAITSGQAIGTFSWQGYNGTSYVNAARVLGLASEAYSATTNGTYLEFDTTASGTTARAQSMRLMAGAIVGPGTTDPGVGNLTVSGTISSGSPVILPRYTVTALPVGSTGMIAMVTDATSIAFATTVVGGGTGKVLVLYTGSNWVEA